MNRLEYQSAIDTIQAEIDLVVIEQGNHTELSYVLRGLSMDRVRTLLAHIIELKSTRQQITYDLLDRAIGEEEVI